MREFRLLNPDEIECRVAQVNEKYVKLLLYKTARTDAALLDEAVGHMFWCNDYKVIDGKMYCGIGIKDKDTLQWVWKWNCGTESNMEKEKGEASDAFKRAGFVWGIGADREDHGQKRQVLRRFQSIVHQLRQCSEHQRPCHYPERGTGLEHGDRRQEETLQETCCSSSGTEKSRRGCTFRLPRRAGGYA